MFYNAALNWSLRSILGFGAFCALLFALQFPTAFSTAFATEDGPIETATAVLLACASVILLVFATRATGYKRAVLLFYAVAVFFGAGEEISWGQRMFGVESSEFFQENNFQGETNLHNLVVGDTHLTEVIFGTGLAVVIMLYLVVLPLLYPFLSWVRRLCGALCIPVPQKHIGLIAIAATLFSAWIGLDRQWEVYEFAFSVILCLVFLNPANGDDFQVTPAAPSS